MADWLTIKTEYVTGEISQRKLAEKYGVSYSSLRGHAEREQWAQLREEHQRKTGEMTAQKTAEKVSDAESEIAAIKARARLKIWAEIERRVVEPSEEMDGSDFRRMVQNYCDMNNAEPDNVVPSDAAKEDDLSKSLREMAEELESDG